MTKREIISDIKKKLKNCKVGLDNFNNKLCSNNLESSYKISAVQLLSSRLRFSHNQYFTFQLDGAFDIGSINKAVLSMIKKYAIFRTFLKPVNNELVWLQYQPPDEIDLPIINLTKYIGQTQEKIISGILGSKISPFGANTFWYKLLVEKEILSVSGTKKFKYYALKIICVLLKLFSNPGCMFQMVIINKNLRQNILVLWIDHIIYDAATIRILNNHLNQFCKTKENLSENQIVPYSEYIETINKGPCNTTVNEIIEITRINEYPYRRNKVKEKFHNVTKNYCYEYNFLFNIKPERNDEESILGDCFNLMLLLSSAVFNIENIPLLFVYNGRKYQRKTFYKSAGLYLDVIPFVIDVKNNISEVINDKLTYLTEHNIHFINLMFDQTLRERFNTLTNNFPINNITKLCPSIVYNYVGNLNGFLEKPSTLAVTKTYNKSSFKQLQKFGGFYIIAGFISNKMIINVQSLINFDEKHVYSVLNNYNGSF